MSKVLKNRQRVEKLYLATQVLEQFEKRLINIKNTQSSKTEFSELENNNYEGILRTTLHTEAQEIKNLMLMKRNDIPMLNNRTNAELLGFDNRNMDADKISEGSLVADVKETAQAHNETTSQIKSESVEETTSTNKEQNKPKFIEDAFEDLDKYCDGILENYKSFRFFIEKNYKEITGVVR